MLPLGWRVHQKIANIIRLHIDAMGAHEFHLPAIHPARIWQQTGRWDLIGDEMFRLEDRKGAELALGFTHEEIGTSLGVPVGTSKARLARARQKLRETLSVSPHLAQGEHP